MNPRRRLKTLITSQDDAHAPSRGRMPAPAAAVAATCKQVDNGSDKAVDQAAGSAWFFADFLAACMTLPPDQFADLADLE